MICILIWSFSQNIFIHQPAKSSKDLSQLNHVYVLVTKPSAFSQIRWKNMPLLTFEEPQLRERPGWLGSCRHRLLMQILDCGTRSLEIESECHMARYFASSVHTEVPWRALPKYPFAVTPPVLYPKQKVSLVLHTEPAALQICLFYNITEFEDVLARFCEGSSIEVTVKKDLRNYNFFSRTNGHPGMFRSILVFTEEVCGLHIILNQRLLTLIEVLLSVPETHRCTRNSFDNIRHVLEDDEKLLSRLKGFVAGRGFPSRKMMHGKIDQVIFDVLLHVLRNGSVDFYSDNSAMVRCFRSGFIYTEVLPNDQVCRILPSHLHAREVAGIRIICAFFKFGTLKYSYCRRLPSLPTHL